MDLVTEMNKSKFWGAKERKALWVGTYFRGLIDIKVKISSRYLRHVPGVQETCISRR